MLTRIKESKTHIVQVGCKTTQNPSVSVQVGTFERLVEIMARYYDKMPFYMEVIGVSSGMSMNCKSSSLTAIASQMLLAKLGIAGDGEEFDDDVVAVITRSTECIAYMLL